MVTFLSPEGSFALEAEIHNYESIRTCNILIFSNSNDYPYGRSEFELLKATLESLGNTVRLDDRSTIADLSMVLPGDYSQFWFIDGKDLGEISISPSERDSIISFAESGKGLALLADHEPTYTSDANYISTHWGLSFNNIRSHFDVTVCNASIDFYPHPIATGLTQLPTTSNESKLTYSGLSSEFEIVSTFLTSGNNDTMQATLSEGDLRIFFDCSFTRYTDGRIVFCGGAGITLVENIWCWLEPGGCTCDTIIPCNPAIDTVWFSEETTCDDQNIVEICYILSSDCPDTSFPVSIQISENGGRTWNGVGSPWFPTIWDTSGDMGDGVSVGEHCFYWLINTDVPNNESCEWTVRAITYTPAGADTSVYSDCLDSRPPEIVILCPTGICLGDTYTFEYSISDLFYSYLPCSLHFFSPGIDESYEVYDTIYDWIPTIRCESCTLIITSRDSFCNWAHDTCIFPISQINHAPNITNILFFQRTDGSQIVDIYYFIDDLDGDSVYVTVEVSIDRETEWYVTPESFILPSDTGWIEYDPGAERHIIWNMEVDIEDCILEQGDIIVRIFGDDKKIVICE